MFGSAKDAVLFGKGTLYFYNSVGTGQQPGRLTYRELGGRQLKAQGAHIDLGHGQQLCLEGSAVTADKLLGVLEGLRDRLAGGTVVP